MVGVGLYERQGRRGSEWFSRSPSNLCLRLISLNSCPGERQRSPPADEPNPKASSVETRAALRGEPRADEATSFIYLLH